MSATAFSAVDLLAVLFEHLGLRHLRIAAATCAAWAAAAAATAEGWRILSPMRMIGTSLRGTAPGQYHRPTCLAQLPDGQLCVADTFNHRIVCLSPHGDPIRLIGILGDGPGEFRFPRGVACDGQYLYVAETGNCRLQRLSLDGTPQLATGAYGHGAGAFFKPHGIALIGATVYVADTENHRISAHDAATLRLCFTFCRKGFGPGLLNHPRGLAATPDGELLVCDSSNHRVCTFSASGDLLRSIGSYGAAPGEFAFPQAVAPLGDCLLVAERRARLQVCTSAGLPLQVLQLHSAGDLCGLHVRPDAREIYVSGDRSVHVLAYSSRERKVGAPSSQPHRTTLCAVACSAVGC
jgi:DNA-binding beta-propeller fold protein YncE